MTPVPHMSLKVISPFFPAAHSIISIMTAIRIFGIFTLAELHRSRFWNTLGRQSERRSSDYIERCTFRNEPQGGANDNVILPATFPALPEQDGDIQEASPLDSDEDIKEVGDILAYII